MAQEPVKPINELERKTWVSDQDLILILDSSTGEARLADKEELRGVWIQDIAKSKSGRTTTITFHTTDKKSYQIRLEDGDDWLTPQFALEQKVFKRKFPNEEVWKILFDIESFRGEKGEAGKNPEFKFSGTHIQRRLQGEGSWKDLIPLSDIKGRAFTYEDFTLEQLEALRGGKGDKGNPWESPEFRKTNDYLQIKLPSERTWKNLIPLADITWPAGSGAGDMLKAANLSDLTNKETARTNLEVYSKTEIADELSKKSNTAHNHDSAYYKKAETDEKLVKKADLVDGVVPSNQLPSYVDDVLEFENRQSFPTNGEKGKIYISINDDSQWRWTGTSYKEMVSSPWSTDAVPEGSQNLYFTPERAKGAVQSELNGKADLVGGKVPASQLPEVNQIDESNLVHKSWDEVIGGVKIFENWIIFRNPETDIHIKDLTLAKYDPKETQTISQYAKATNWTPWGIHFVDYVSATPNWLWNWSKQLRWYLHIWDATRTFDHFQTRWYEWFDWTEASLPNARKYIKLDAPKILLWDEDILWEWKTYTPTVSANWSPTITESFWKYQKIWKTVHCKVKLRVRRNWSYWRFFVSLPVNARDTWEIVDGTSVVWTFWASNSNNYGYITVSNWHAQILWGIWRAGNFGNLAEDVFISFSITYEAI